MQVVQCDIVNIVQEGCDIVNIVQEGCDIVNIVQEGCDIVNIVQEGCDIVNIVQEGCDISVRLLNNKVHKRLNLVIEGISKSHRILIIQQSRDYKTCDYQEKFNIKSAETSRKTIPCTNRPITCPKANCGLVVWSYFA